jgi:acetyl-CoA synthetase
MVTQGHAIASTDPDAAEARAALLADIAASADPSAFWLAQASAVAWRTAPSTGLDAANAPTYRWFADGTLNITESALDRHVRAGFGAKTAFVWRSEDLAQRRERTYEELLADVCRAANALRSCGVGVGDRVVIYMPLVLEAIVAMLACARIGAVHSVVYAGLGASALRSRIEDAGAKAVIVADYGVRRGGRTDLLAIGREALDEGCAAVDDVFVWRRDRSAALPEFGRRSVSDWSDACRAASAIADPAIVAAEHPLFLLYTSGTTGKPKGVVHVQGGYAVGVSYHMRTFVDVRADERYLATSDIGWIVGHSCMVYGPLMRGITTVFREGGLDHPTTAVLYDVIAQEKIDVLFTAPTALRFLMKFGDAPAQERDLTSLRWIMCAGEPLNPEVYAWARRVLCGETRANIGDNWWQTEAAAPCIGTPPGFAAKPGSAGIALPGVHLRVLRLDGTDADADEAGALYVTQPFPHLFRTVWGDDERFRATWDAHGYRTGDAAQRDAEGYVTILGRTDDVIQIAGHRIGSAEIENALLEHPHVAEAAAIGIPDPMKGESLVCFITLRVGAPTPDDATVHFGKHLRATFGPIAVLSKAAIVASLPKTRSGKIMRRVLRARELGLDEGDLSTLDS